MAVAQGLVHRIAWTAGIVCVAIGPAADSAELLFVAFRSLDDEKTLGFKRSLVRLLAQAATAGYRVSARHPDSNAEIDSASFGDHDISPVNAAIQGDAYSVTGSGIPDDVQLVFDHPRATVTITPDLVRPHWVLVSELPAAVPAGRNTVQLVSPGGWTSDAVPVDVSSGPALIVRALYTGEPKDAPYSVAFVANPGILTEAANFVADAVLTNRAGYLDVVGFCLRNMLTLTEDVLRQGNRDLQMRFTSIFDPTLAADDGNSLAHEINPNLMETRRTKLNGFLSRFQETADIACVIHGSITHDRATAWFTTDDSARPGTAYTLDGANATHGHFPSIPGSAALPLNMDQTGLTPLHEFGHAGSDFNNGMVVDLYVDGAGTFVNRKARALNTDPIPGNFSTYNGTNYPSDQNRDGLGYPAAWVSYHPALIDPANPDLMDNYWLAPGGNPLVCRLSQLTYAWYADRLRAKLNR